METWVPSGSSATEFQVVLHNFSPARNPPGFHLLNVWRCISPQAPEPIDIMMVMVRLENFQVLIAGRTSFLPSSPHLLPSPQTPSHSKCPSHDPGALERACSGALRMTPQVCALERLTQLAASSFSSSLPDVSHSLWLAWGRTSHYML